MYLLVLLKLRGDIYFDIVDDSELSSFIESIAAGYGHIDFNNSTIITGESEDLNHIMELIESSFVLLDEHRISGSMYVELLEFIGRISMGITIVHGVIFDDVTDRIILSTRVAYDVYIYCFRRKVVISLVKMDGYLSGKSFKCSFENIDESLSMLEGFRHDFMEIISSESESYIVVTERLDVVIPFIEKKIGMMSWRYNGTIMYLDGTVRVEDDLGTEYLTSTEVIRKLRISDQTLANWRKKGLVDFRRISDRKYLYLFSDIDYIFENGIDPVVDTINKDMPLLNVMNYAEEILGILKPYAFKIPEHELEKHNYFLNFGNIGISSSPQVMINNNFQLIDYIKKQIICETPKELHKYLMTNIALSIEPILDTSKKIQKGFSNCYLHNLYDDSLVAS